MIPDKIYVKEFDEGISQMWSSIKATETTANVQHEYIRKDALLEWLEQELAQRRQWFERYEDAEDLHACNELTKIINKLSEEVHVQDTDDNVVPVGNAMCKI